MPQLSEAARGSVSGRLWDEQRAGGGAGKRIEALKAKLAGGSLRIDGRGMGPAARAGLSLWRALVSGA